MTIENAVGQNLKMIGDQTKCNGGKTIEMACLWSFEREKCEINVQQNVLIRAEPLFVYSMSTVYVIYK